MEYLILVTIGLFMGFFGGLLGIGGSLIMIPAMIIIFKGNQHLYQASAMICNFFVAASATFMHRKEKVLVWDVVKWLIPAGIIGILLGVAGSNIGIFQGENSRNLTRLFGAFLLYDAVYNIIRLRSRNTGSSDGLDMSRARISRLWSLVIGFITGFVGGLLGTGGGTLNTPLQQLIMKMPLKRAISNSSALIVFMAAIGATLKNATLPYHGIEIAESLRITAFIVPTAVIGGAIGGRFMQILPKDIVRILFIALVLFASYKMLTV